MRDPSPALLLIAALAAVVTVLLVASTPAEAADVNIRMQLQGSQFRFSPSAQDVFRGDQVIWHHDGPQGIQHNVRDTGNQHFSSPDPMNNGETFTWGVPQGLAPGTINYVCDYHPSTMTATLTVRNRLPSIAITSPPGGGSVSGTFTVSGTAGDEDGTVTSVIVTFGEVSKTLGPGNSWSTTFDVTQPHGSSVVLRAKAVDNDGGERETQVTLSVNAVPSADFTFSPASPTTSDTIAFNDTSTDDHLLNAWRWDFGDGNTSTLRNATHRLATKGAHTVKLNVTDDHGANATVSKVIQVLNSRPRADFRISPPDPAVNETLQFLDQTVDADNDLVSWSWDFGDGNTSTQRNPFQTYAAVGSYTVRLSVVDVDGANDTLERVIEVLEFATQRPVASIVPDKTTGQAPLEVRFAISGYDPDGTVANWTLSFGDGQVTNGPASLVNSTVTHTYTRNGTFLVNFTVRDNLGVAGTNSTIITVTPPPNRPPSPSFTVTPSLSTTKGRMLRFSDQSTDPDPNDAVVRWEWSFGDGDQRCCDQRTVDHAYTRVGTFSATLKVTDNFGASASRSVTVSVVGEPPRVLLASNATSGRAPFPVTFSLDASDADGAVTSWVLDFGDGRAPRSGQGAPPANVTHVYESPGSFSARLDVVDDDGLTARAVVLLTFQVPAPPVAPLSADAISIVPTGQRLTYRFTSTANLAGELAFQWAFGDGRTGTGREVVYSYLEPGTYTVTLSLAGPDGPIARASRSLDAGEDITGDRARVRSEVASGIVRVTWSSDIRAAGYQVWRSVAGGPFVQVGEVTGTSYSDLEVADGVPYAYRVTFFSADGSGRLQRLSQLPNTQAFRMLGEVRLTGLVDRDGDGVGDSSDAFPDDPTRSARGLDPIVPLALVLVVGAAAYGGWRYRDRLVGMRAAPVTALTAIPGLEAGHAAVLQRAGITDLAGLAAAAPEDLARRTVLPLRQLRPWWLVARLAQVPGVSPQDAGVLLRAGVQDPSALARASPAELAARLDVPVSERRVARWVRAARWSLAHPGP